MSRRGESGLLLVGLGVHAGAGWRGRKVTLGQHRGPPGQERQGVRGGSGQHSRHLTVNSLEGVGVKDGVSANEGELCPGPGAFEWVCGG